MLAYDRVTHDGKTVDRITHEALLAVERRLGYPLTIVQGSYSTSVSASAGTHSGGGVVDLSSWDYSNKVRALRSVGFAAWYRPALAGVWSAHVHAVLIGNERLSPAAQDQVVAYYAGRDGLASNGPDPHWRPDPIPAFTWAPERLTRGAHIDSALKHLANAEAPEGSERDRLLTEAKRALRSIPAKTTTSVYTDGLSHSTLTVSRGAQVDAALQHVRRALLVALSERRKALIVARDALLAIRPV